MLMLPLSQSLFFCHSVGVTTVTVTYRGITCVSVIAAVPTLTLELKWVCKHTNVQGWGCSRTGFGKHCSVDIFAIDLCHSSMTADALTFSIFGRTGQNISQLSQFKSKVVGGVLD